MLDGAAVMPEAGTTAMRRASPRITPLAVLSGEIPVIRNGTQILGLPGSERDAVEHLLAFLPTLGRRIAPGEPAACTELPAFAIGGWSGSGKTTLIVELVRHFAARKLKIAVIKHDVHGLDTDRDGKDSDRFFRAGADAVLCVVEGHKSARLARKVWLLHDVTETCPPDVPGIARALAPDEDRFGVVASMIEEWLQGRMRSCPVYAGILFGGRSQRMGRPKHLLSIDGKTWLEHIVAAVQPTVQQAVLLGAGEVPSSLSALPILPDVVDKHGPLAGMLAAMRWNPSSSWLFTA